MRFQMKVLFLLFATLCGGCATQNLYSKNKCLKHDDQVLIRELFTVSQEVGEKLWPQWNKYPFSILFVEDDTEFLIKHPNTPQEFDLACKVKGLGKIHSRKRVYDKNLLAAFPAVDMVPTIVMGNVQNTPVESSTEWLTLAFHEHFHQIQYSQPSYYKAVAMLNPKKKNEAQWMTHFPFPYHDKKANKAVDEMKSLLLNFKNYSEQKWSEAYTKSLKNLKEAVGQENYKYFRFQVWQEGVSRYIEYKTLKTLENHKFSKSFQNLSSFEEPKKLFSWKKKAFKVELQKELKTAKRSLIYSIGLYEILAKEHFKKSWEKDYFSTPLKFDI